MSPITISQLRALTVIHTITKTKGYPLTRNELARELGCSTHNASYLVNCLDGARALSINGGPRGITFKKGNLFIPIKGYPGGLIPGSKS